MRSKNHSTPRLGGLNHWVMSMAGRQSRAAPGKHTLLLAVAGHRRGTRGGRKNDPVIWAHSTATAALQLESLVGPAQHLHVLLELLEDVAVGTLRPLSLHSPRSCLNIPLPKPPSASQIYACHVSRKKVLQNYGVLFTFLFQTIKTCTLTTTNLPGLPYGYCKALYLEEVQ
jgi:hypothetical protein